MDSSAVTELSESAPKNNAWDQLSDTGDPEFFQNWLSLQCNLIVGSKAAILALRKEEEDSFEPVAVWPEVNPDLEAVSELIDQVIEQETGLITLLKPALGNRRSLYGVAYPVIYQEKILAIIAVTVMVDGKQALQQVMKQLQWGCAWVELSYSRREYSQRQSIHSRLTAGVDLLAKVLAEQTFDAAAMRLVSEMAIAQQSELVSLGFVRGDTIRISHLSNSAQFGKKMNLLRRIEAAMNESTDQRKTVIVPVPIESEPGIIALAHNNLAEQQQKKALLTLPLYINARSIGTISFQRDADTPFSIEDAQYCESIAALAVAALEEKRLNERSLVIKIFESAKQQAARIFGPGYLGRKVTLGSLLLLIIFFSTATSQYRLSADATLKPMLQRVVVAPYDGFIQEAPVRAGDQIAKSELLVSLDDGDMQLEKLKWLSQKTKLTQQFQEETASYNRANIKIIQAQLAQATAQLQLVESQLLRARQLAPFDGLVVSGDLSQQLGGAVKQGEVLFEVSPVNEYRIYLQVKESRIADVKLGQEGKLYLSALPEDSFSFVVDKITPLTVSKDGATYFTIEANILERSDQFQPGMEGIGKIDVDQRKLWSIWTREIAERLRLLMWSWWG